MYAGFLLFLMFWMVSFCRARWSTVALPFCPPAWASVILMVFDILLLIILSNIFPKLLARVIPLSFEHFPFVPLPLYSLIISPVCHWVGILCVCIILLIVWRYMSFTFGSAFVNISFGILSGPVALLFFIRFIVFVNSFIVAFSGL